MTKEPANTPTVAQTILAQLGGMNRLTAMVGVELFLDRGNGVSFKFKGSRKANVCQITLDASDTYTVKMQKFQPRKLTITDVYESDGIYADQLIDTFEQQTGLYLTL